MAIFSADSDDVVVIFTTTCGRSCNNFVIVLPFSFASLLSKFINDKSFFPSFFFLLYLRNYDFRFCSATLLSSPVFFSLSVSSFDKLKEKSKQGKVRVSKKKNFDKLHFSKMSSVESIIKLSLSLHFLYFLCQVPTFFLRLSTSRQINLNSC